MTRDPKEGLAPDGAVTTGVGRERVDPVYEPLLTAAVAGITEMAGRTGLEAVYLYGSVATGRAIVPTSDVDLMAVMRRPDTPAVAGLSAELSSRFRDLAREVAIGVAGMEALEAATDDGHALRCFVRHYCVLLTGVDLAATLPACRPTRRLALGFAGQYSAHIDEQLAAVRGAGSRSERDAAATRAARRLLLAAAPLISIVDGSWTTDRERAARLVARHYPDRAEAADELWQAIAGGAPVALDTLESFRDWLTLVLLPRVEEA